MAKHNVTLVPLKETVQVEEDKPLFQQLRKMGYPIKTTCGGVATCSECVVKILENDENCSEITFEEKKLLGNVYHITKERLSCQLKVLGDVTIDISRHLSEEKKKPVVVRKTKAEVEKQEAEKQEQREIRRAERDNPENKSRKKLGGSRRPKVFHYRNPKSED